MTAVATPDAARLVFAAVAGLILLLILIIKFKVHAMISILIGAVGIGLMAGMPLSDIIGSVNEGIGNTLKGIMWSRIPLIASKDLRKVNRYLNS